MITLRKGFEREIHDHELYIENLKAAQAQLEERHPELFDIEAPRFTIGPSYVTFHDEENKTPRGLGTRILNALSKAITSTKQVGIAGWLRFDKVSGITIYLARKEPQPCKKVRVTQTRILEVCGDVDESLYDSVEYLDD